MEQPTTDSKEIQTTQPETEVVQDVDDIEKSLDNAMNDMGITDEDTKTPAKRQSEMNEENAPEPTVEGTRKPDEVKTEIKPDEKTDEVKTDEEPEFKIEDLKIKRKGEEVPITTVLQEFHKAGQLQEFVDDYTSKKFDYYSKTQEHSKSVKDFNAEIEAQKSRMEAIEYKNFAISIGEENLKTKDYFENALDSEGELKFDDPDKAYQNYMSDVKKKGEEYVSKVNGTMQINNEHLKNFANKYSLSYDDCENEFLPKLREYLNPTIAQGQMPLKEDTFDVFYKGTHHDELLKVAVEKAVREAKKSAYGEIDNISSKSEEPIHSSQEIHQQTETDEDFKEMDRQFNEQI